MPIAQGVTHPEEDEGMRKENRYVEEDDDPSRVLLPADQLDNYTDVMRGREEKTYQRQQRRQHTEPVKRIFRSKAFRDPREPPGQKNRVDDLKYIDELAYIVLFIRHWGPASHIDILMYSLHYTKYIPTAQSEKRYIRYSPLMPS